eukprot:s4169_g3.t1
MPLHAVACSLCAHRQEECAIKTLAIEQLMEDEAKVREMLQELEELGEKEVDSVGNCSPAQWLEGVSPCLTSHAGGALSASTSSLPCASPMSACLKVPPHGPSASPESSPSHLKAAREDLTREITQLEDLRLCVQQICFALRSSVHDDPAGEEVSPEPPLLPRPALAMKARALIEASLRPAPGSQSLWRPFCGSHPKPMLSRPCEVASQS